MSDSLSILDQLANPISWSRWHQPQRGYHCYEFHTPIVFDHLPLPAPWLEVQELILKAKDRVPQLVFPADFDDVCRHATRVFGQKAQENMLIGEMGELLTLFGRRAQGRATDDQWVDELVDVIFMCMQLSHVRGIEAVRKRMAEKIEKIKAKLAKYIECTRCNATGTYRDVAGWQDVPCTRCGGTGHIKAFTSPVEATPPTPSET